MMWMARNYPHLVKRVRRYAMMMAGLGAVIGFYAGISVQGFVRILPALYAQLIAPTGTPLYVIYLAVVIFAFLGMFIGRRGHPDGKGRR